MFFIEIDKKNRKEDRPRPTFKDIEVIIARIFSSMKFMFRVFSSLHICDLKPMRTARTLNTASYFWLNNGIGQGIPY